MPHPCLWPSFTAHPATPQTKFASSPDSKRQGRLCACWLSLPPWLVFTLSLFVQQREIHHNQCQKESWNQNGREISQATLRYLPMKRTESLLTKGNVEDWRRNLDKEWRVRTEAFMNISQDLRRAIWEGNSNPLQYSCLENPMGGGTS